MMDRGPALVLLGPVEHREVRDPHPAEAVLLDEPELLAEPAAECAEHAGDPVRLVGGEEDRGAGIRPECRKLLLREELRDRRPGLAVLAVDDVGKTLDRKSTRL